MRPELGTCIRAPVNSKLRTCIQTQYSFAFNSFTRNISVTALLEKLDWTTLENRRNHAKVTMFYKIINDIVSIDSIIYNHHLQ